MARKRNNEDLLEDSKKARLVDESIARIEQRVSNLEQAIVITQSYHIIPAATPLTEAENYTLNTIVAKIIEQHNDLNGVIKSVSPPHPNSVHMRIHRVMTSPFAGITTGGDRIIYDRICEAIRRGQITLSNLVASSVPPPPPVSHWQNM